MKPLTESDFKLLSLIEQQEGGNILSVAQTVSGDSTPSQDEAVLVADAAEELVTLEAERRGVKAEIERLKGGLGIRCQSLMKAKSRNVFLKDRIYFLRRMLGITAE